MEVSEIIKSIYQELIKKIGKIEWENSKITAELFGDQIVDFTLNLTMVATCDSIDISDESVGLYADKHENIEVYIWFELYDKNDHRLIMPYKRMSYLLERKIQTYLKD